MSLGILIVLAVFLMHHAVLNNFLYFCFNDHGPWIVNIQPLKARVMDDCIFV